jgi:1-pyrroline dehydrogenase
VEHMACYIGGEWRAARSGARADVVDPATEAVIATVPACGGDDVGAAAAAAAGARERWAGTTPAERSERLLELAAALLADAGEFARIESRNTGKPAGAALGEIHSAVDRLRFFAGAARCLEGRAAGEYLAGYTSMIRREPVGVAGLITPWNYPLLLAVTKLAPALAAGNAVVLKPSEQTPLTALRLAALAAASLPAGVLNVVTGDGAAGAALVTHPDVDMISLTGGSATGKEVSQAAAATLKRVHLELGGKAPCVVLDDADPAQVAAALRAGAFWNAGQDCSAASRVIVSARLYDGVADALLMAVSTLRVGGPADPGVEMGPLTYAAHRDRVADFIERAAASGATILAGGDRVGSAGFFLAPTVMTGVSQRSEIVQCEVFGPVVTIQQAPDDETAFRYANDIRYGLGASVFTRDVGRAMDAARRLRFGTVWINDHGPVTPEMPWGGFKESGNGTERSVYSLEEFTQLKHVMIKLPASRSGGSTDPGAHNGSKGEP